MKSKWECDPSFENYTMYKSKRLLYFANLICSQVSGPKVLKKACLYFPIFNFSEKLQNMFEIGWKKTGVIGQKSCSQ